MKRRTVLGGALARGRRPFDAGLSAGAIEQEAQILTWNIADQEALFKEEFAEFQKHNPGVEIEWLDKKGPELPAFYQTQLVAGTPPDIIDTARARSGSNMPPTAPSSTSRHTCSRTPRSPSASTPTTSANWAYEGKNYMLPFYITKTLLFYNKTMFKEAGLAEPPKSFDEIMSHARTMAKGEKTGLLTLNFDWLYWPLLQDGRRRAPLGGRQEGRLQHAEGDRGRWTSSRRRTESGAINKISWTGRWVEPNGAFASGTVGMHARPFAGILLRQGPGAMGERRHARRHADARRLVDAEQPWARHLEGIEEPGTRLRAPEAHDLGQVDERVHPRAATSSPGIRPPTRPGSSACARTIRSPHGCSRRSSSTPTR